MTSLLGIRAEGEILRVTFRGVVRTSDILAAFASASHAGRWVTNRRLWDVCGCDLAFIADEFAELAAVAQESDALPGKLAVLVDSDLNFGLLRMYQVYRESRDVGVQLRVFRDEEDATRWLRLPLDSPGLP